MFELCRIEIIIFDGIAGTVNLCISECRNFMDGLQLYVQWHTGRETIEIHLICIFPFGFEKKRMLILVGESDKLGFY